MNTVINATATLPTPPDELPLGDDEVEVDGQTVAGAWPTATRESLAAVRQRYDQHQVFGPTAIG